MRAARPSGPRVLKILESENVMATITIKIDSEELAREVLNHLGYLPSDDIPDLISIQSDEEPRRPESSRDTFAKEVVVLPSVLEEVWCPEPNDDGFGTPIDHTFDVINSVWVTGMSSYEAPELEKKEKTQKEFRAAAALMKERLTHSQYLQFLEVHKIDPNLDPDITKVVYELLGDTDENYLRYFEEKDRISYKQYLEES